MLTHTSAIQDLNKIAICIIDSIVNDTLIIRQSSLIIIVDIQAISYNLLYRQETREVSTPANTIQRSRTTVLNRVFYQMQQSISISNSHTTNTNLNEIRLQCMETTLQSSSLSDIAAIGLVLLNLCFNKGKNIVIHSSVLTILISHQSRMDKLGSSRRRLYRLTVASPVRDILRSRSITLLQILLIDLSINILKDALSTTESSNILDLIRLSTIQNKGYRQLITSRLIILNLQQKIHEGTHVARDLRTYDDSRNHGTHILSTNRLHDILTQNSIKQHTHVLSIDRVIKEINLRIINSSYVLLAISDKARIHKSTVNGHTIIHLDRSIRCSSSSYIYECIHTISSIDRVEQLSNPRITIGRSIGNIIDILQVSFSSRSTNDLIHLLATLLHGTDNISSIQLRMLFHSLQNRLKNAIGHQDGTGSTITNSLSDIQSDGRDIILDRLLNDTIILDRLQNGMTIFGILVKCIELLNTGIRPMRTKAICKNLSKIFQNSRLNSMQGLSSNDIR